MLQWHEKHFCGICMWQITDNHTDTQVPHFDGTHREAYASGWKHLRVDGHPMWVCPKHKIEEDYVNNT